MIKFFRKIRQKLLSENKFSKYLLYAIGEIVLVVIGILIALQINSWNEYSKNRKLEKDYYLQFKAELEENIRNAEDQIGYSSWQVKNAQLISDALEFGDTSENSQDFFIALEHLGKTYPTQYTNNVWTEILSNGKTAIIRNENFRSKLAFLNSDLLQTIYLQDQFKGNILAYVERTNEVLSSSLRKELVAKFHPVRLRDTSAIPNLPPQSEVIEKLNKIAGVKGYITEIQQTKELNEYLFLKHKKLMLELVKICETELKE